MTRSDPMYAAALSERVIVLAPFGRDASIIAKILREAGGAASLVRDMTDLCAEIRGGAAAVLLTEEALAPASVHLFKRLLEQQPAWSDLPVLLLLGMDDRPRPRQMARSIAAITATCNVTVLQRPLLAVTLATAVQSALRARRRQYEVRDLIARERAAREEAEAATRLKDEFLASVSHELRTPLSAILIWAQLLDAGRVSADQARHAARSIVSGAEAQSRLIEDLLDVSRMLSGKLRLELTPMELAPSLLAAVDVVRPMADAKGVRLEVRVEPTGDRALIDPDRVQQMVWNLLSNAVKFTPKGGHVRLSLAREPEHLRVAVEDTGEGIHPELLPHVFERFRQGGGGPQRRRGGLGLGLSIVQQLVELHGGAISATSEGEGRGASFVLRLPITQRDRIAAEVS